MKAKRKLFITDYCLTPNEYIANCGILCEAGKIIAIGGASAFVKESKVKIVDIPGAYAVPGFIDTHIHGAGGFDSSTAYNENADIEKMSTTLASHGVTSFLPAIVSAPPREMLKCIDYLAKMISPNINGAEPVGIHMEGPFLNKVKHGSQRDNDILEDIDIGLARELISAAKGTIKICTFAPELPGAIKFIELLLENGIKPSMGHCMAEEKDVLAAVDAGALRCTHIYNGMPPLHHREVALTAVALTDDRITIEIIADGVHINPRMIDLACRTKPKDKIIGVSDAVEAAGLRDGTYHLGTSELKVEKGLSKTTDGIIAGTTMTLEQGWHHLVTYSHLTNREAARCFTANPANDLSLSDRGELKPGKRADISFFDTGTNKTLLSVSRGKIIYDSLNKFMEE
jgi:N-acetylglucosamine-6-phosphate deacetylase